MGERGTRVQFGAFGAWSVGAVFAACTGTAPPNAIAPPDISKISVFYPLDGLVQGRGGEGAAPRDVSHISISAYPTGTRTTRAIEPDGSFDFAIIAISDDVLEIAGATDVNGDVRGEPIYVRVPPRVPEPERFLCCGEPTGTCQAESQAKRGTACPDRLTGARPCASVSDCRIENHEILPIDPSRIEVTSPDGDGLVTVRGTIMSQGALVRLENRGQSALGGRNPGFRRSRISDASGAFEFRGVAARGDDELVVQILDLLGNRSPPLSILVPDSPLGGIDIVGAYSFRPLESGGVGTVAIRLHPYGIDGFGLCPNSNLDPILCFTGGLTHAMVQIDQAVFDENQNAQPVETLPSPPALPHTRATEGDPSSGPQNIVLVMDMSDAKADAGIPPFRFDAARQFVRTLRDRDKVGIVSFGGDPGSMPREELPLSGSDGEWSAQLGKLAELAARPSKGSAMVFSAVGLAADMFDRAGAARPGRIVVIAAGDVAGPTSTFDDAIVKVIPNPETGFQGYAVRALAIDLRRSANVNNVSLLRDMTVFAPGGAYVDLVSAAALEDALLDTAASLSGSYVLLYDMAGPRCPGKSRLRLRLTVQIPGPDGAALSASNDYEGPLSIGGVAPPGC